MLTVAGGRDAGAQIVGTRRRGGRAADLSAVTLGGLDYTLPSEGSKALTFEYNANTMLSSDHTWTDVQTLVESS